MFFLSFLQSILTFIRLCGSTHIRIINIAILTLFINPAWNTIYKKLGLFCEWPLSSFLDHSKLGITILTPRSSASILAKKMHSTFTLTLVKKFNNIFETCIRNLKIKLMTFLQLHSDYHKLYLFPLFFFSFTLAFFQFFFLS